MSATQVYQVQAPDGSVLHIEGPANATDEQITAAAAAAYGDQGANAAPEPPRMFSGTVEWNGMKADYQVPADRATDKTLVNTTARNALVAKYPKTKFPPVTAFVMNDNGDHVSPQRSWGDYARLGVRSATSGLLSVADFAGNAVADPIYKDVKYGMWPFNSAESEKAKLQAPPLIDMAGAYNRALDAHGVPSPSTDGERLTSAGVAGASGALATGGAASLPKLATMGVSGAASGVSSEAARQQGYGPGGQIAAGMIGGVLPIGAASATRETLGAIGSKLPFASAERPAAMALKDAAFNPEQALANVKARPAPSPETAPTLAEVAKDPGLAAFQRSKRSTAIQEQQRANALARANTVDETAGKGNPQAVQDLAQQQAAETSQGVVQGREAIGPDMSRADSGAQVRQQFTDAQNAARARTSAAYNDPALTAEPQPVTLTNQFHADLADAAKPFYGDGTAPMSPEFQAIVQDLRAPNATTERFGNIDRRLADFAANVRATGGSNTEAAAADQIRNVIESHAKDILPPEQVAALQNAKRLRAEQGQTFEQGNAAEAFRTKRYGEPVKDDVELPHQLLRPNGTGGATVDRLSAAIGPDATEATIRAELRRVADEGQVQTPKQVQALVTKYGETLQRFPGIRDELKRLHDRAALNETFLKSPLGKMTEGDPSTAIGKVIFGDDPAQATQLINQVKSNPSALSGLRRSFGELISRAGKGDEVTADGVNIPNPAKTSQAIDMVLTRGGDAFTSQQKAVLKQVKGELDSVSYAEKAGVVKSAEGDMHPLEVLPPVSVWSNALRRILKVSTNQKQVDALVEKALIDPALAAELLGKPTPARLSRLKSQISAAAIGAAAGAQEQQQ